MGIQPIQIVLIVSAVLGFLLLIASSLFMELNQDGLDGCGKMSDAVSETNKLSKQHGGPEITVWDNEPCESVLLIEIGAIFGLFAAITQILSAAICFRNLRPWCLATIAVFILAVIAFSLPMSAFGIKDGILKIRSGVSAAGGSFGDLRTDIQATVMKTEFFVVMSGMDFCFAILAIAYGFYVSSQENRGVLDVVA